MGEKYHMGPVTAKKYKISQKLSFIVTVCALHNLVVYNII